MAAHPTVVCALTILEHDNFVTAELINHSDFHRSALDQRLAYDRLISIADKQHVVDSERFTYGSLWQALDVNCLADFRAELATTCSNYSVHASNLLLLPQLKTT